MSEHECTLKGVLWVHKLASTGFTLDEGTNCGTYPRCKCTYCSQFICENHMVYIMNVCHRCIVNNKHIREDVCPKIVKRLDEIYGAFSTKAARST